MTHMAIVREEVEPLTKREELGFRGKLWQSGKDVESSLRVVGLGKPSKNMPKNKQTNKKTLAAVLAFVRIQGYKYISSGKFPPRLCG